MLFFFSDVMEKKLLQFTRNIILYLRGEKGNVHLKEQIERKLEVKSFIQFFFFLLYCPLYPRTRGSRDKEVREREERKS